MDYADDFMGGTMSDTGKNEDMMVLMQRMHRWRTAFLGLVILLVGMVIGGGVTLIAVRREVVRPPVGPEVTSEQMVRGMRRELRLSPEQMREIEPVLEEHLARMHEIRMAARPQIGEELRAMNEEIMSVLDEEQRQIWMRRLDMMERELRPGFPLHRRGGVGPGPRGGREGMGPGRQWRGGEGMGPGGQRGPGMPPEEPRVAPGENAEERPGE
jgi:hypothetical protein